MLPMATYFIIGPQDFKICKCSCNDDSVHQPRLGLSGNLTALNTMLTFIFYFPTILIPVVFWMEGLWIRGPIGGIFVTSFIPFLVLGWCFTGCSFQCCCNPDCYKAHDQYINVKKDSETIEIRQRNVKKENEFQMDM